MAADRLCSINGCGNALYARSWCEKHYRRWNIHGDPLIVLKRGPRPRLPSGGKKRCTKCLEMKPLDGFAVASTGESGRRGDCRLCRDAEARRKYIDTPIEKRRLGYRRATLRGRLEANVSSSLYHALKSRKGRARSFVILDFTVDDLLNHLERQFTRGMTWDNYGHKGWHIDHIVPVSSFRYETADDVEFKLAWALPNLRPLWARDNYSKGARRLLLL